MSWRTVVISSRCKLDLNMGYMVVRGEETKRIFIDEISILIIENPAVSMTGCLLSELSKNKIKIIFCDEMRNPYGELQSYYGCHDSSRKIKAQMQWTDEIKKTVWTEIVSEKIRNQAYVLECFGYTDRSDILKEYVRGIHYGDETNREGHAAKVYFNALFGMDFSRGQDNFINAALNYGYSLLLSAINREIVANGYLTQLGIFHDNMFNQFNLSCDLMEPFRPVIDREVYEMDLSSFEKEQKYRLIMLLNSPITISGSEQTLLNALKIYTKSIFDALNDFDLSLIKFPIL